MPFQDDWITQEIKAVTVLYADEIGKQLAEKRFTTSQFRNFYGELKRIQMGDLSDKTGFHLLRAKLAYSTARAAKNSRDGGPQLFKKEVEQAYKLVNLDDTNQEAAKQRFERFCSYIEAILAFHKSYGGKD